MAENPAGLVPTRLTLRRSEEIEASYDRWKHGNTGPWRVDPKKWHEREKRPVSLNLAGSSGGSEKAIRGVVGYREDCVAID
jgi:hypothetical protein